jgi:hypothetical protein
MKLLRLPSRQTFWIDEAAILHVNGFAAYFCGEQEEKNCGGGSYH